MNRRFTACLVSLTVSVVSVAALAQQAGGPVPLQRGVSVQMAVTRNAVSVPNADRQDALVVAVTANGTAYLGGDALETSVLADRVRSLLSARSERTVYIKADARLPYMRLIEVMDALQTSGIQGLTLLTAQRDAAGQAQRPVSPKGLAMRIVTQAP